jgi:putative heme-binding domain-containing protein
VRIAALETVADRVGSLRPQAFELLRAQVTKSPEPLSRLAAARTLGAVPLSVEQSTRVAASLGDLNPMVLRLVLPAFAASSDVTIGMTLVSALERCPSARALSVSELDRTLKAYPAAVHARAKGLREALAAGQQDKQANLARLSTELAGLRGDPDAGQELFLSAKLGCFGCHRAVGRGGIVGPDLSQIGRIRSRPELLESIVFPGLSITPQYRTVVVATRDGRVTTGLVTRDTPEAVTLRTVDLSELRIRRADIEEITPAAGSLMPEGFEKIMSRQELCNLLEFLGAQR